MMAEAHDRHVVDIQAATPAHVSDIARIHAEALPGDFLPSLGLDFLERVHYPATMASPFGANLVAVDGARVVGFVTIAHDAGRFSRELMQRAKWAMARYALRAAARDPRHLLKSVAVLRAALGGVADPVRGEIFLIAVDGACRGRGVGQALVGASLQYLAGYGVDRCRTKTLAANAGVIGMYAKLGWTIRERFTLIGLEYVTVVSPPILSSRPVAP